MKIQVELILEKEFDFDIKNEHKEINNDLIDEVSEQFYEKFRENAVRYDGFASTFMPGICSNVYDVVFRIIHAIKNN